eukprot:7868520-Alexandrium_andersonii.AAC.1
MQPSRKTQGQCLTGGLNDGRGAGAYEPGQNGPLHCLEIRREGPGTSEPRRRTSRAATPGLGAGKVGGSPEGVSRR